MMPKALRNRTLQAHRPVSRRGCRDIQIERAKARAGRRPPGGPLADCRCRIGQPEYRALKQIVDDAVAEGRQVVILHPTGLLEVQ